MKIAAIHLGHSHLAAMVSHLDDRPQSTADAENEIKHFIFDIFTHKDVFKIDDTRYHYGVVGANGDISFNPVIIDKINALIPEDYVRVYFTQFGGNSYNTLTLLTVADKYDFHSPFLEGVMSNREIIPYSAMNALMYRNCKLFVDDIKGLANNNPDTIYHIVSPPPIRSEVDY